jgi:hypothetical protein
MNLLVLGFIRFRFSALIVLSFACFGLRAQDSYEIQVYPSETMPLECC